MRLTLVARFKILSIVTEFMDFRVNGAFVPNTPNQMWQTVNWKEQASFHIFCANFKNLYIHSVCPNPWGFHNCKTSYILIWRLEAADLLARWDYFFKRIIPPTFQTVFKITWENAVPGTWRAFINALFLCLLVALQFINDEGLTSDSSSLTWEYGMPFLLQSWLWSLNEITVKAFYKTVNYFSSLSYLQ